MNIAKSPEPSLQKLQELEKTYPSIPEQIVALNAIVTSSQTGSGTSRAQWALRWLLRKFQLKDDTGLRFRQLSASWSLIHLLSEKIPVSSLAQLLQQQQFLSSLATTLEDDLRKDKFKAGDGGHSEPTYFDDTKTSTNDAPGDFAEDRTGPKRKNGHDAPHPSKRTKLTDSKASEITPMQIAPVTRIKELICGLQTLAAISSTNHDDGVSGGREFLKSVLRPDPLTAHRILLGGMQATRFLLANTPELETAAVTSIVECLTSFLDIWEGRKSSNEQSHNSLKDKYELPALGHGLVCAHIIRTRSRSVNVDAQVKERLEQFVKLVERFAAKYGVMPMKSAFHRLNIDAPSLTTSFPVESAIWNKFPFESAGSNMDDAHDSPQASIDESVPISTEDKAQANTLFLECALKCSSLHVPKKRAAEMSWVQMLFSKAFALSLEDDTGPQATSQIYSDFVRRTIDLARRYGVTFDDPALAAYLLQVANAYADGANRVDSRKTHWDIVDGVMMLFPTLVVPARNQTSEASRQPALSKSIVACITRRMWNNARAGSSTSLDMQPQDYELVKTQLVPRLVKLFQTSRSYIEFLSTWHEQLSVVIEDQARVSNDGTFRSHVWQDPVVVSTVASVLITAMPLQQKLSAIESLTSDEPALPAFTVLESILRAPPTLQFLQESLGQLALIVNRCLHLLDKDENSNAHEVYWRVLAHASIMWVSIAPAHQLENGAVAHEDCSNSISLGRIASGVMSALSKVERPADSSQTELLGDARTAVLAIGCLSTLLQACSERHCQLGTRETLKPKLEAIFDAIQSIIKSRKLPAMIEALRPFPSLGGQLPELNELLIQKQKSTASDETLPLTQRDVDDKNVQKWRKALHIGRVDSLKDACQDASHRSLHKLSTELALAIAELPSDVRVRTLYQVLPSDNESFHPINLQLLKSIILSRTDWGEYIDTSTVLMTLSQRMPTLTSHASFDNCYSVLFHVLQLKKARASQNAIETIVTAIAKCLSPSGPSFKKRNERSIYKRLCQIIRILLTRNAHRKRLRGRAHVLMPVLQGLLRCLFVAHSPSPSLAIQHPPWLTAEYSSPAPTDSDDSNSEIRKRPDSHCATDFARLLSLFADPPLSAVSSSSASRNKPSADGNDEPLTDPTAQARTYASHFAPLIVGEYAHCLLRGRYCAEGVKEALQPGLWALMDVIQRNGIGIDALGSMTGRAEGARDVLRSIVGDWKRLHGGLRSGQHVGSRGR